MVCHHWAVLNPIAVEVGLELPGRKDQALVHDHLLRWSILSHNLVLHELDYVLACDTPNCLGKTIPAAIVHCQNDMHGTSVTTGKWSHHIQALHPTWFSWWDRLPLPHQQVVAGLILMT